MYKTLPFFSSLLIYTTSYAQVDSNVDTSKLDLLMTDSTDARGYVMVQEIPNLEYSPNLSRLIDGKVAGVQSSNGGGQPGSDAALMIRGYSTRLGDNSPLIVVDGFPYFGELSSIDPADVETITILKDAISSIEYSQYGNANGVIKVVTKKGKRKHGLTVEGRVGITTNALPSYKTMGVDEYYETAFDGLRNHAMSSGLSSSEAANFAANNLIEYLGYNAYKDIPDNQIINPETGKLNNPGPAKKHNDDWNKELRRIGLHHSYNLSFGNATDKTDYTLNAGYIKEQGYIPNTSFERLNARINVHHKFTNWLSAGINAAGAIATQHLMNADGSAEYNNPVFFAQAIAPIYPIYYRNAAGEKELDPATGEYMYDFSRRAFGDGVNPLASLNDHTNRHKTNSLTVIPYLQFKFLKDFRFTSYFFRHYVKTERLQKHVTLQSPFDFTGMGLHERWVSNYSFRQKLEWEKQMGAHNLDVAAGMEYFSTEDNQTDKSNTVAGGSSSWENRVVKISFFGLGMVKYNFANKYFAEASFNFGRQGTSDHAPRDRYVPLSNYAFSLGWAIGEEQFLKYSSVLSQLKLRGSYGTQTGRIIYSTSYAGLDYATYSLSDQCKQINAGIEFGILKNRIAGTLEFYSRNLPYETINLSTDPRKRSLILLKDFETTIKGIELNLSANVIRKKNFTWNVLFNASGYKSTISTSGSTQERFIFINGVLADGLSTTNWSLPESVGIDPVTGLERWYAAEAPGRETNNYVLATEINNKVNAGQYQPTVFGGLQNLLLIGKFDFSFNLTYSLGGKLYDAVYQHLMSGKAGVNYSADLAHRWTPENTSTDIPKATLGRGQVIGASTRFLRSASFLNIRTVTLGYTFKENSGGSKQPKSLRVYVTADNLWLFTAHRGMNPQDNFDGITRFSYSPARTILFGVSVVL
jgi:TonB-linked SusC/RagA family outer membrane protein